MIGRRTPAVCLAGVLLAAACSSRTETPPSRPPRPPAGVTPLDALAPEARSWVDSTLVSLELDALAAQLVIPWIAGSYTSPSSPEFQELADWVERGIGGVSISIGLPHSYADKLNHLQEIARVPLLVTSDFENGGPGMRINHAYAIPSLLPQGGGTSFPPTMAFGAIGEDEAAFEYGRITAVEARAVGVHMIFAPVLDVNSNPLNPVINTRAFGEDPKAVARLGTAFIRGVREGGALSTAKHFPGHGDTSVDSHIAVPVVAADRSRLNAVELVPFQAGIDAEVDAVMTAHVAMPALLGEDAPPATLSPELMTGLLREEMGFDGVLFTDALRMGAITEAYGAGEAAVLALEAGSDVLLAPADVPGAIDAVVAAAESGRLSRARLESSARRILQLKARTGLHRWATVPLDEVSEKVGTGPHLAVADDMASRAVTLPRDRDGLVPLDPARTRRVLSVTWARNDDLLAGSAFEPLLARYVDRVERLRFGPATTAPQYDSARALAEAYDLVVVSAYMPPRSGAGSVGVPEGFAALVSHVDGTAPTVVISFGSPYVLTGFPEVGTYLVAWGDREVSQTAAARALVGQNAIGGRLPVSIPPLHAAGDGLDRAAQLRSLRPAGDPLVEAGMVAGPRVAPDVARVLAAPSRCWSWPGSEVSADTPPAECPRTSVMTVSPAEVDPERAGMDGGALQTVDTLILRAIGDGATPGAVLAVGRHGRIVRLRGYGRLDWDDGAPPAGPRSIYDMASVTKVVATTTAAMLLVDEGRLDLDARVVDYLPWWDDGDPAKAGVTVRQLLIHRAGLPPFRRFYFEVEGETAYRDAIGAEPLEYVPGERTVYSDIGLMTLGFIVAEISGRPLDDFVSERILDPLGMADSGFTPDGSLLPRIAPTEVDTVFRHVHVHGVVHDENAYAMGGVAGHAGLFSSAADLAAFAQMMLNGGESGPCPHGDGDTGLCAARGGGAARILEAGTVASFTARFDDTASRALGWDTPSDRSSAGDYFTRDAFGHTGYTGTSLWIDPERDVFVVLLTTRVNPTRENGLHVPLRRAVHDAVALAITDQAVERREP